MSDSSLLISGKNLALRIAERSILEDVGIDVRAGEIVSLIGPNGGGKTSLVRLLLGLGQPTSGTILRRAGLRIGYVPQKLHIDQVLPLTVDRFLDLAAKSVKEERDAALSEVGALHVASAQVNRLSGGEFQRVLLARALLRTPELLVLDEPVQGVDIGGQEEIYGLIARVRQRLGCGVLLVSHDLHLVMAATDRVVCVNHHLCCSGQPEHVIQHPNYLAIFGATGMASLAPYAHHHDHHHDAAGGVVPHEHHHHHHHGKAADAG